MRAQNPASPGTGPGRECFDGEKPVRNAGTGNIAPAAAGRSTNLAKLDEAIARLDAYRGERLKQDASALLNEFNDTDIANAQRLARQHGENLRYTTAGGWLVFDGKRWVADEKDVLVTALAKDTATRIYDEIKRAANRDELFAWAKRSQSRRAIEAMIVLARSESGIFAKLTDFDNDPFLLNLANGTVDLRTGKQRKHQREDFITKIIPISYDQEAHGERWDAFLWRVTGQSEELYGYLRRLVGYLLTGSTGEQVLHFLHGLGSNGKSVFCEVLSRLLGDYGVVLSPDVLMLKRHGGIPNDIARLRGARMAAMNETTQGSKFDEAKLKDLTGGDTLTARFLHREFFDFAPTHKLLIRGNHKPAISGTDEGIWRRLRLVPFTVQIPPDEQDHQLVEKLTAELPGILNWAIKGCLEWQREGLKPPAIVTEAVSQYRAESDTLGRFIAENCTAGKLAEVKSSAFFQRYQEYCERSGERWLSVKELPHEMRRRGFEQKRQIAGVAYLGLEFVQPQVRAWAD